MTYPLSAAERSKVTAAAFGYTRDVSDSPKRFLKKKTELPRLPVVGPGLIGNQIKAE
jgi:hypothetical protein